MEKTFEKNKKILAVESSGKTMSIAAGEIRSDSVRMRGEVFLDIGLKHSEMIQDSCAFLLERCSWPVEELSLLAVCTGPGSFTGLRMGISFTRALAQTLRIPLIGVPTFDILRRGIYNSVDVRCILIESIGQEVFAGIYTASGKVLQPCKAFPLTDLIKKLYHYKKVVLAGSGFLRYEQEFRKHLGSKITRTELAWHVPRAAVLSQIAGEQSLRTKLNSKSWKKVVPYYLRPPIAVERANHGKKR